MNIKTSQDMLGLTCRDFSPLFPGTAQLLEPTTVSNSCLIAPQPLMHIMHIYHEWTMPGPTHPPQYSGLSAHMPKHPFMLTTQKSGFFWGGFSYLFSSIFTCTSTWDCSQSCTSLTWNSWMIVYNLALKLSSLSLLMCVNLVIWPWRTPEYDWNEHIWLDR